MSVYRVEHKGYYVQPSKDSPGCYSVVTVGKGGKIPDCLGGMYTKRYLAHYDIDLYLESKNTKEESDGKTNNTGRGK